MLWDYRCHRVILIQPEERKKQKSDRRDASSLSEYEDVSDTGGPGLAHVIDRLEMDHLLVDLEQAEQRILDLERVIRERCGQNKQAYLLCSMPGISYFTAKKKGLIRPFFLKAERITPGARTLIEKRTD